MHADGTITTCEIDHTMATVAQTYFDKSPKRSQIRILVGDAEETLQKVPCAGV